MSRDSSQHFSNVLAKAACALVLALTLALAARAQTPSEQRLEETTWAVNDSAGGPYIFELKSGGLFRATSWSGAVSEGTWSRDSDSILVRLKGSATEYRGHVNGARIEGEAKSKGGRARKWEAQRQEALPVHSSAVMPQYPPIAKAARAEGSVTIEVKVDGAGRVSSATAMSGHPLLQQAAVAAAKRWEFNPDANTGTRVARLFFMFETIPVDCKKRQPPTPAPEFLSTYQVKVRGLEGCIEYSVNYSLSR
jgi:TonB family protein